MAAGLPVEGDDGPFVGDDLATVPTLSPDGTVGDARAAMAEADASEAVVVGCDGLAIGLVDDEVLHGADDGERLLERIVVVPSTIRPSVTLESLGGGEAHRILVTTPDGRLVGMAAVKGDEDRDHDHGDQDHGGHDHGGHDDDELTRMEEELDDLAAAVRETFGDRDPTEAELHSLLRDRLMAEGRSPEEADRFLADLGGG